jgi:hypothetical protein
MGYGIAHAEVPRTDERHPQLRALGSVMAAAALRNIGTRLGANLAVHGQRLIENQRQARS